MVQAAFIRSSALANCGAGVALGAPPGVSWGVAPGTRPATLAAAARRAGSTKLEENAFQNSVTSVGSLEYRSVISGELETNPVNAECSTRFASSVRGPPSEVCACSNNRSIVCRPYDCQ